MLSVLQKLIVFCHLEASSTQPQDLDRSVAAHTAELIEQSDASVVLVPLNFTEKKQNGPFYLEMKASLIVFP